MSQAIQDSYPDSVAHCYGCGRLNEQGLHVKSYWDAEAGEAIGHFRPQPYHTAVRGYVYGGLIASLIDCHATGTAAAVVLAAAGRGAESPPPVRFVTASLRVDFLRPTPLDAVLELRGRATVIGERKVLLAVIVAVNGEVCARGEVVCVRMPDNFGAAD